MSAEPISLEDERELREKLAAIGPSIVLLLEQDAPLRLEILASHRVSGGEGGGDDNSTST
jgi:hypothetical protein